MKLHFREYGRGDPLILLHGLFGSHDNWHTISQRLAERWHVFAVDQRNHGHSPHAAEMSYPRMAEDLARFCLDHSLSSAQVVGHSMGGKTAMQFALAHPERVARLAVVDVAPRAYDSAHSQISGALLSLDLQTFQTRRQVEEALAPAIPELAVRRFLLKNLAHAPAGGFRWKLNLLDIFHNHAALNAALESDRPFEKPALFIRGGRSDYIQERDLSEIRRLFPRAEIHTIAAAGHWVQADAPDAFIEALENFLAPAASAGTAAGSINHG
jgi:esterase